MSHEPATPSGCVTFDVVCARSPRHTRGPVHSVTLFHDWSIKTPHDLDAERVAVGLGSYCDCLALVDRALPAAQEWLALHLRRQLPAVAYSRTNGWELRGLPGTDSGRCYRTVQDAVKDAIAVDRIAKRHHARAHHLEAVARALSTTRHVQPNAHPLAACLAAIVHDPDAASRLWDAGVAPDTAIDLLGMIPNARGRVPIEAVLALAYVEPYPRRDRELRRAPSGAQASWMAWSSASPFPHLPLEFAELLGASREPRLVRVTTIFSAGYRATDIDALAHVYGSASLAVEVLFGWAALGCTPSVEDLLHVDGDAPPSQLLEAWLADERVRASRLDRTVVALLVAACSPPPAPVESWEPSPIWDLNAIDAVAEGVRTPDELRSWFAAVRDR